MAGVTAWPTISCRLSTATCALYACTNPSGPFMIRDSRSIKLYLYCAFVSGFAASTGLPRGGGLVLCPRLQRPFGVANPLQPTLASLQFRRQLVAAPIRAVLSILGGVRRLGLREQLHHLVTQVFLLVPHPSVSHRLVLRRVRFHLGPVERHSADQWRAQFARHLQDLLEKAARSRQVRLPKIGDRAKVRLVARGQDPEWDIFEQAALEPARREDAHAVAPGDPPATTPAGSAAAENHALADTDGTSSSCL